MKMIVSLLPVVMLSATLLAQQPSTPQPAAPPAPEATAAPAAERPATVEKKKTARPAKAKPAIVEPTVTLLAGKAVVTGKNVNVRARSTINSESIVQLNPGDTVTVIEQINLDKFKPDEPRQWAKIAFPENADVWVHVSFIDRATMTVIPNKLNLRAGPGENYSVVGALERGTQVREVLTDGNWMRIAPAPNAYAFIAAMYLQQEAPAVATAPPETTTSVPPVSEPVVATAPVVEPAIATESGAAEPSAATLMTTSPPSELRTEPPAAEPPPPRVVSHEGVVKRTVSIQAPTDFALTDKDSGRIINYLHSPTTNLNLGHYRGLRIVVTGEEGLDSRWTNTPVITIKRIHVIE